MTTNECKTKNSLGLTKQEMDSAYPVPAKYVKERDLVVQKHLCYVTTKLRYCARCEKKIPQEALDYNNYLRYGNK